MTFGARSPDSSTRIWRGGSGWPPPAPWGRDAGRWGGTAVSPAPASRPPWRAVWRPAGLTSWNSDMCGTEQVYHAVFSLGLAGGIMVTASHNPVGDNGMKLVREGARPLSGDTGLDELGALTLDPALAPAPGPGTISAGRPESGVRRFPARTGGRGGAAAAADRGRLRQRLRRSDHRPAGRAACRSSSSGCATSRTAPFRRACPTRCCRRTAASPPRRCGATAPTSDSPGTAISIAASSSTSTATSWRATTWSACSPRQRCGAGPARASSTIRA